MDLTHALLLITGIALVSAYYLSLAKRPQPGRMQLALLALGSLALFAHAFLWRDVVMALAGLAALGLGLRICWTAARQGTGSTDKPEDTA